MVTPEIDRRGSLDMPPDDFRAAAHAVVDIMADYLESIETRPVLPPIEPGSLRPLFPVSAPEAPESIDAILADYTRLIEPNATHWQHPGFFAYFPTTASGPGHPRGDADRGDRPERDALADLADRHRAGAGRRRTGCARRSACRRRSTDCSRTRRRRRRSSRSPRLVRRPAPMPPPAAWPDVTTSAPGCGSTPRPRRTVRSRGHA